jgi:hypothetical protein
MMHATPFGLFSRRRLTQGGLGAVLTWMRSLHPSCCGSQYKVRPKNTFIDWDVEGAKCLSAQLWLFPFFVI